VETLLGNLPVANVAEGTSLTLLLRPEAIVLSDDPGATPGRVLSTRRQGRGQQCLVQLTGINVPMTVRVDSPQLASVGEIRGFSLARDHVLVFETETGRPI
jgi:ABC-type Fe3+/spermidine/putrescine transport system ATPase subunit